MTETPQSAARALVEEATELGALSDPTDSRLHERELIHNLASALSAALGREGIETMEADAWHDRALAAEAREQRGRELLQQLEWAPWSESAGAHECPSCRSLEPRPSLDAEADHSYGHAPDCPLAAYLSEPAA